MQFAHVLQTGQDNTAARPVGSIDFEGVMGDSKCTRGHVKALFNDVLFWDDGVREPYLEDCEPSILGEELQPSVPFIGRNRLDH